MRKIFVLISTCLFFTPVYTQCPDLNNDVVFINEIHYDNAGTDINEGVEIAGPAGTNLAGYSLVFYNGADGLEYMTEPLAGIIPNQAAGFGTLWFPIPGIQNGVLDGIALYNGNTFTVVQFLSYGGTFTAGDGVADGITSEDIGVTEGNTTLSTQSLQLTGGPGNCPSDFTWTGPTTGSGSLGSVINVGQTFVAAGTCLLSGLAASIDNCFTGLASVQIKFTTNSVNPNFSLQVVPDPGGASQPAIPYAALPYTIPVFFNADNIQNYQFVVSDPGCISDTLNIIFNCPIATTFAFDAPPTTCMSVGEPFSFDVCAVNAAGDVQPDFSNNISLAANPAGFLTGATTGPAVNGCATFTFTPTGAQNFTFTASSGALTPAASGVFEVVPECPSVEILTGVINPCGDDSQNEYIAAQTGTSSVNVADMVFASIDHTSGGIQPNVNYTWSANGDNVAGSTTEVCGAVGLQCNRILDINDIIDGPIIGNLINQLNTQAGCPLFVAPMGAAGTLGTIPANARFVFFQGAGGNATGTILPGFHNLATNMDFSIFCGLAPIYAIFGEHNNPDVTLGFFANAGARTYQVIVNGNITTNLPYPIPAGTSEAETIGSDLLYYQGADCVPVYLFGPNVLAPELLLLEGAWTAAGLVQLDWQLADASGVPAFVVERSSAGGNFEPVGEVNARAGIADYTFTDVHSGPGQRQYRLKMVLPGGDFRYSDRISLEFADREAGILSVFPNPATDRMYLAVNHPQGGSLSLRLSTPEGRTLSVRNWEVSAGISELSASLADFPPGLYLYQVVMGGLRKHGVIVKQ